METWTTCFTKTRMTRRSFLKFIGGAGLGGMAATIVTCSAAAAAGRVPIDADNPAIVRDERKCIFCGQCLRACEQVQSVYGYYDFSVKKILFVSIAASAACGALQRQLPNRTTLLKWLLLLKIGISMLSFRLRRLHALP